MCLFWKLRLETRNAFPFRIVPVDITSDFQYLQARLSQANKLCVPCHLDARVLSHASSKVTAPRAFKGETGTKPDVGLWPKLAFE